MSWIERMLVWSGGYGPRNLTEDRPEDREPIAKIGSAVLLATAVAVGNWGMAGWLYSDGRSLVIRIAVAVVAAFFGASLVLVIDRGFLFFLDTAGESGRLKFFVYGFARVLVILAVGSITAQAVMPMFLASEMKGHALHMVEDAEKHRASNLTLQYGVAAKEKAVQSAGEEVKTLEKAAATLPPDIEKRLAAARKCWFGYSARKTALVESGHSEFDARSALAAIAASCSRDSRVANADRDAYFARVRAQLDHAIARKQEAEVNMTDANSTIKARLDEARQVEEESFTAKSSTVLWSLITSNPGAFMKWALIAFVQLVVELFPLFQKLYAGQSFIGRRIANSRAVRMIDLTERLNQREHDFAISCAVNDTSKQGVSDALMNPDVRAIFAQEFAANISAFAPTEAVRAMMRDLEARHVDVEDFMHRFPRFAAIIGQAWSQAVKRTSEILASGVRAGPINGVRMPT